jgi:integrase
MAAPMEKTQHPGIFKRGNRYVVVYKVDGRQRKESARTLDEARRLKAVRMADRDRGEFQGQPRIRFRAYAEEWVERYQGNGRRGFSDNTRDDYRRDLERYAFPFFDKRLGRTLAEITPRDVATWIGWLCDEKAQRQRLATERGVELAKVKSGRLADQSVRRIVAPLRSCLATAKREGLIRHNPARRRGRARVRHSRRDAARLLEHPQGVLAPAVEEADASWAGFHTFRHTCASMLFERGANAVQVQRWPGHHSAAFTLATYVHLLDSGVGEPLDLSAELGQAGDQGSERLREFSRSATFCS